MTVKKAVIPVAGMGTRFLPATKSVPKEMLPIVNIPTIHYIVEEAVKSGIEEILFITSPHKKAIEDYFDRTLELEHALERSGKLDQLNMLKDISNLCKFTYIRQGEAKGTAHAINLARNFIGNEPFAVMYGDDLIKSDTPVLKQLIDLHDKTGANIIGVRKVKHEDTYKYGIIDYEDLNTKKIRSIVEKPKVEEAPSDYAGLGRYIVNPEIFDEIEILQPGHGSEYQFTDAMAALLKKQDFYACEFDGIYFDIGNHLGYIKANIDYALDREDLKEDLKEYIKSL
ncbi:MAG: UTP--glucose-1-phosphate uridylyltransferase GalU [Candidatus Amulumruptor caecigallinarius]|nr:UTP--glucose-1-phosphate uridylyltransferase GalU [Candidatus Amulumruptor caecigallinarius]